MTWKQIEASREARLWISQVLFPTAVVVGAVLINPDARKGIAATFKGLKKTLQQKVKKD